MSNSQTSDSCTYICHTCNVEEKSVKNNEPISGGMSIIDVHVDSSNTDSDLHAKYRQWMNSHKLEITDLNSANAEMIHSAPSKVHSRKSKSKKICLTPSSSHSHQSEINLPESLHHLKSYDRMTRNQVISNPCHLKSAWNPDKNSPSKYEISEKWRIHCNSQEQDRISPLLECTCCCHERDDNKASDGACHFESPSDCGASLNTEKSDFSLHDFSQSEVPSWYPSTSVEPPLPIRNDAQCKSLEVRAWLASIEQYKYSTMHQNGEIQKSVAYREEENVSCEVPQADAPVTSTEEVNERNTPELPSCQLESDVQQSQRLVCVQIGDSDSNASKRQSQDKDIKSENIKGDSFDNTASRITDKSIEYESKLDCRNSNSENVQVYFHRQPKTNCRSTTSSPSRLEEKAAEKSPSSCELKSIPVSASRMSSPRSGQQMTYSNVAPDPVITAFFMCPDCAKMIPKSMGDQCQRLSCNAKRPCNQLFHGIADLMMHFTICHKEEVRQFRWCLGCNTLLPNNRFTSVSSGPGLCLTCIPIEQRKFKEQTQRELLKCNSTMPSSTQSRNKSTRQADTEYSLTKTSQKVTEENDNNGEDYWDISKTLFANNNYGVGDTGSPQNDRSRIPLKISRGQSYFGDRSKTIKSYYVTRHPDKDDKRLLSITNELKLQFIEPGDLEYEKNIKNAPVISVQEHMGNSNDPIKPKFVDMKAIQDSVCDQRQLLGNSRCLTKESPKFAFRKRYENEKKESQTDSQNKQDRKSTIEKPSLIKEESNAEFSDQLEIIDDLKLSKSTLQRIRDIKKKLHCNASFLSQELRDSHSSQDMSNASARQAVLDRRYPSSRNMKHSLSNGSSVDPLDSSTLHFSRRRKSQDHIMKDERSRSVSDRKCYDNRNRYPHCRTTSDRKRSSISSDDRHIRTLTGTRLKTKQNLKLFNPKQLNQLAYLRRPITPFIEETEYEETDESNSRLLYNKSSRNELSNSSYGPLSRSSYAKPSNGKSHSVKKSCINPHDNSLTVSIGKSPINVDQPPPDLRIRRQSSSRGHAR